MYIYIFGSTSLNIFWAILSKTYCWAYPVFVWSCKQCHFLGQAPELSTRSLLKRLLWKSGRRVQHMQRPIQFSLGLAGDVTFQVRPRRCSEEVCPRKFSGEVECEFNT